MRNVLDNWNDLTKFTKNQKQESMVKTQQDKEKNEFENPYKKNFGNIGKPLVWSETNGKSGQEFNQTEDIPKQTILPLADWLY